MNSNVENSKMEAAVIDLKAAVLYKASQFANHCDAVVNDTNVKEGETKEEYVNRMEANVDMLHNGFNKVLTAMADATGFTFIKDSIYKIMDAGLEGSDKGKKDLYKMVDKYKALVQEELDFMAAIGNEQSIKDAIMLKAYTEDERGKSIFESFFGAIVWIGKRVARKLRQWFKVDDEGSIMNALCRKLSFIGNTLRKGGRFVFNAFNLLMGYVVAGTIKVVETITNFLISAFNKVKEWATAKFTKAEDTVIEEAPIVEEALTEKEKIVQSAYANHSVGLLETIVWRAGIEEDAELLKEAKYLLEVERMRVKNSDKAMSVETLKRIAAIVTL